MRLIDADGFLKDNGFLFEGKSSLEKRKALATPILLSEFLDMIDDAPTVEIKAVNHGGWFIQFPYGPDHEHNFKCSECGHISWCRTSYCGNCGATMDEGWQVDLGEQEGQQR